jgi:hypothetical protein
MYYIINWKHSEEGYAPDLPEGIGFALLAEPGRAHEGARFALFKCHLPEDIKNPGVKEVNDKLTDLFDSASDYPPAMTFTRADLDKCKCETESEFSEKLIERLEFHLKQQIHSPFFMARAAKTEIGYRYAGGYYWIVGCKNGMVEWVSRDYFIYQDPIDSFELDMNAIDSRFGGSCQTQK